VGSWEITPERTQASRGRDKQVPSFGISGSRMHMHKKNNMCKHAVGPSLSHVPSLFCMWAVGTPQSTPTCWHFKSTRKGHWPWQLFSKGPQPSPKFPPVTLYPTHNCVIHSKDTISQPPFPTSEHLHWFSPSAKWTATPSALIIL
jgi:hypothetical protein